MSDVLIVDDSPADRALFRTLLSRDGIRVHEVATGAEALSKAAAIRPHVVILDVNLPDMDGHAVCRALRADPTSQGIPILMLTIRDNAEDVLNGLEAGADDYVTKDAPTEIILARVRRLARYRQMATVSLLNEQLAQIGRLLAGIIHEIRGPLAVIRGNAELIRLHLGQESAVSPFIEPIIRSVQILQVRMEHLMATVRGGPAKFQALELEPLIREAAEYFRKGSDPRQARIELCFEFEPNLPQVRADAGRLIQVLLNLLGNAREAIVNQHHEGRITIRARPEQNEGHEGVVIEVIDSGPGIPEDLLDRIFEPFFTTKESGTGYGLYLGREILQEHGGRIWARNHLDGGACFQVWLPIHEPAPAPSSS